MGCFFSKGKDIADKITDGVKDQGADIVNDLKIVVTNVQHIKMWTFVSLVSLVLLILSLATNEMVVARDVCNEENFGKTVYCKDYKIKVTKEYSFGLWKVNFGGDDISNVCNSDGWPLEPEHDLCTYVRVARAAILVATALSFLSVLIGAMHLTSDDKDGLNDQGKPKGSRSLLFTLATQALAAAASCTGYCAWQWGASGPLMDHLKADTPLWLKNLDNDGDGKADRAKFGRYHATLGFTYGLLMWTFLWPFFVWVTKIFLPFLDFAEEASAKGAASAANRQRLAESSF